MDRAPIPATALTPMAAMSGHLDVQIRRRLGAFVLDAEFNTPTRGLTALFGRSGSGKSTIVAAISGLLRPDCGRIVVGGETLFDSARRIDVPPERRRVGYVFQDARLFPHLKVRDNLAYGLKRAPADSRAIAFDAIVELLGIEHLLDRRPLRLSGGEKQRVAIGRALLAQPRVLLMDEPLASLDAARHQEIMPYIERLRDGLDCSIVYVSHSVEEVVRLAQTMVIIEGGRTVAQGTPAELSQRLDLHPLFGRFEAGSVIEGRVADHDDARQLTRIAWGKRWLLVPRIEAQVGAPLRIRVRARNVILAVTRPTDISVQNILEGIVMEISDEPGPYAEVKVEMGGSAVLARVTRDAVQRLGLEPRKPVYVLVKSVAIDGHSISAAPIELD